MSKVKIMLVCGSPRKGNSETVLREVEKYLKKEGVETNLILLRQKKIGKCEGCVDFCNHKLYCKKDKKDDMRTVLTMMRKADGFVFISPTYFSMPTGTFKNFIDRSSILFTAGEDLTKKAASVISIGSDAFGGAETNAQNLMTYCHVHGMLLVDSLCLIGKSELYQDYNHILKSKTNGDLQAKLKKFAKRLYIIAKKMSGK